MRILTSTLGNLFALIKSPFFILLTVTGNGMIGMVGVLFYYLEKDTNPKMTNFIDSLWWSFSTATTTGYGDITPITLAGKILGIFTMLAGMALFSIYTGLFADALILKKSMLTNLKE